MKPVVLIERTAMGDAYRYSRFANGESTHIVETPTVEVSEPLVTLSPEDVELLRRHPEKLVPQ